jgi:hypothetical protein
VLLRAGQLDSTSRSECRSQNRSPTLGIASDTRPNSQTFASDNPVNQFVGLLDDRRGRISLVFDDKSRFDIIGYKFSEGWLAAASGAIDGRAARKRSAQWTESAVTL